MGSAQIKFNNWQVYYRNGDKPVASQELGSGLDNSYEQWRD